MCRWQAPMESSGGNKDMGNSQRLQKQECSLHQQEMFILTLATGSAGQKVNAAGQKPPQINEKKYAMSLFSGLLFNLSNPRDSEHSLFKTAITY